MGWFSKSGQEKADSFDNQYAHSQREGKRKKDAGLSPYDMDAAIKGAGKLVPAKDEKRGKGKHRK